MHLKYTLGLNLNPQVENLTNYLKTAEGINYSILLVF